MSPIVAFAQKQSGADNRTEDANGCRSAPIIGRIVDQDVTDHVRLIEQEALTTEKGSDRDLLFVGILRPDQQSVGAHRREITVPPEIIRGDDWTRRNKGPRKVRFHRFSAPVGSMRIGTEPRCTILDRPTCEVADKQSGASAWMRFAARSL